MKQTAGTAKKLPCLFVYLFTRTNKVQELKVRYSCPHLDRRPSRAAEESPIGRLYPGSLAIICAENHLPESLAGRVAPDWWEMFPIGAVEVAAVPVKDAPVLAAAAGAVAAKDHPYGFCGMSRRAVGYNGYTWPFTCLKEMENRCPMRWMQLLRSWQPAWHAPILRCVLGLSMAKALLKGPAGFYPRRIAGQCWQSVGAWLHPAWRALPGPAVAFAAGVVRARGIPVWFPADPWHWPWP